MSSSTEKEASIANPVGNARYIHHIGISISSSMSCPSCLNNFTASFPASRNMTAPMRVVAYTNTLSIFVFFWLRIAGNISTFMCAPFLSSGPSIGNTSHGTRAGGSSMSQSYPVPLTYLVTALAVSAVTITPAIVAATTLTKTSSALLSLLSALLTISILISLVS